MRACSICLSGTKRDVDDALMAGTSVRDAAQRFGLSKSAVGRHRTDCLRPTLAAAARLTAPVQEVMAPVLKARAIVSGTAEPDATDVLTLNGLVSRLAKSLNRLDDAAMAAAEGSAHGALAALSSQFHRGIEAAAKLQGLCVDPTPQGEERFSVTINLVTPPSGPATPRPVVITEPARVVQPTSPPRASVEEGLRVPDFDFRLTTAR